MANESNGAAKSRPAEAPPTKPTVRLSLTINGVHYRVMSQTKWKHTALVRVERPDASKPTEIKVRRVASFKSPADADAFGTYLDIVSQLVLRARRRPSGDAAAEN